MVLFGDKMTFAIEAHEDLDAYDDDVPRSERQVVGRMCIYVGGVALGDINDRWNSLDHAVDSMERMCRNAHQLWVDEFAAMNDVQIYNKIMNSLWGEEGIGELTTDQIYAEMRRYSKFGFITNTGEMFDKCALLIYVTSNDMAHLLCRTDEKGIWSVALPLTQVTGPAKECIKWYRGLTTARDRSP